MFYFRSSFSLIELLIVIAIVAVLATVVILVLNPAAMLQRARDANRLSDMKTIDQAISLYQEDTGGSLGASSTLYLSIPDPTATSTQGDQCQGLGLSTSSLPSGWSYHCAASSTYKKTDGTGWLPLDFTKLSTGSPLSVLPVDPINQASSNLYYTYVGSGDPYELTALFESSKYAQTMADDGGPDPAAYEVGTSLTLSPFARGLVGYWAFDDATGGLCSQTADSSGMGNYGTLEDASTGSGPTYESSGCAEGGCLSFDGVDDYVMVNAGSSLNLQGGFTISFWAYIRSSWVESHGSLFPVLYRYAGSYQRYGIYVGFYNYGTLSRTFNFLTYSQPSNISQLRTNIYSQSFPLDEWIHVTVVQESPSNIGFIYVNGSQLVSGSMLPPTPGPSTWVGIGYNGGSYPEMTLDDARIYNRALSASEIQAIYNAEK